MPGLEDAMPAVSRSAFGFAEALLNTIVSVKGVSDVFKGLENAIQAPMKAFQSLAKVANSTVTASGSLMAGIGDIASLMSGPMAAAVTVGTTMLAELGKAALQVAGGLFELGLAATPGGVQVFGQALDLLTTTLGAALVPIVVLVIASMLTLADLLQGPMMEVFNDVMDNIDEWAQFFGDAMEYLSQWIKFGAKLFEAVGETLTHLLPLMEVFLSQFEAMIPLLEQFINQLNIAGKGFDLLLAPVAGLANLLSDSEAGGVRGGSTAGGGGKLPNAPAGKFPNTPNTPGLGSAGAALARSGADLMMGNIQRAVNSMTQAMGRTGNIGFSSITEVAKQVQMQAFQSDIEGEKLKLGLQILEAVQMGFGKVGKVEPAVGK